MDKWLDHIPGLELSPSEGMEVLCGSGHSFSLGFACLEWMLQLCWPRTDSLQVVLVLKHTSYFLSPCLEVNMERNRLKTELLSFLSTAITVKWSLLKACLQGGRDCHLRAPTARIFLFCSETAFSQLSQITYSTRFEAVLFPSCSQVSIASRRQNRNLMDKATLLKREGHRHCPLWGPILAAGSRTRQIPLEKLLTESQMQNKWPVLLSSAYC